MNPADIENWPKRITQYGASKEKAEAYNQAIADCESALKSVKVLEELEEKAVLEWWLSTGRFYSIYLPMVKALCARFGTSRVLGVAAEEDLRGLFIRACSHAQSAARPGGSGAEPIELGNQYFQDFLDSQK